MHAAALSWVLLLAPDAGLNPAIYGYEPDTLAECRAAFSEWKLLPGGLGARQRGVTGAELQGEVLLDDQLRPTAESLASILGEPAPPVHELRVEAHWAFEHRTRSGLVATLQPGEATGGVAYRFYVRCFAPQVCAAAKPRPSSFPPPSYGQRVAELGRCLVKYLGHWPGG